MGKRLAQRTSTLGLMGVYYTGERERFLTSTEKILRTFEKWIFSLEYAQGGVVEQVISSNFSKDISRRLSEWLGLQGSLPIRQVWR